MSAALARPLMRTTAARTLPSRIAVRCESTTTKKAAESAKDAAAKASEYSAKAAQGLSRAASAAGPAISGAVSALGKAGGRTGKVIGFIESTMLTRSRITEQVPWVVYYSRVGLELSKIVFHGQKMAPPQLIVECSPVSTFQTYFQTALNSVKNPSSLLSSASAASTAVKSTNVASRVNTATLAAGAVVTAECLGFFTVGEMIGRFKIVGYHGETHAAHH
ncbi:mitochondrial f1f0-atp synthase [Colletotrichum sojae]|uniref:Mitochondrial f1f0-atp synthase n=1 Tax=Colletotrichum sojae TaxID=2175907 RepID=A0A8H6JXW4_9PEZI|nr:mitochondrial f1f0-atp synthase [Colletotrichum sojae]